MPSLLGILGLDATPFESKLNKAKHDAGKHGLGIGAALVEPIQHHLKTLAAGFAFGAITHSIYEIAHHIHVLSEEFRVSTDTIQIWDIGAKKVNLTAEDIGNAFNKIKKARQDAIQSGSLGGFGVFGIGMDELRNAAMTTEQIMEKMRQNVGSRRITEDEDVAGLEIMGRSGAKILSAMQKIHELGTVPLIDEHDIDKIHEASRQIGKLKRELIAKGSGPAGDVAQTGTDLLSFPKRLANAWQEADNIIYKRNPEEIPLFSQLKKLNLLLGGVIPDKDAKRIREILDDREFQFGKEAVDQKKEENRYTVIQSRTQEELSKIEQEKLELKRLQAELEEKLFQAQLKRLSPLQRQRELEREIAEHKKKSISFRYGEGDDLNAVKEDIRVAELQGELNSMLKKNDALMFSPLRGNSLQQIGAYASLPPGQQQLQDNVKSIRSDVATIAKASKSQTTPSQGVRF